VASARVRESATREQIVAARRRLYERGLIATLGPTVEVAYNRMESLEHSARILLAARLLGRVRTLTAEQVRDLVAARQGARRRGPHGGLTPHGDGLETE
jgi:hypothetical protein